MTVPNPDEPDFTPTLDVHITFPVGSSDEERAAGAGMEVTFTSSYLTNTDRIAAMLRLAEQLISEEIRIAFNEGRTPLAPDLDDELQESLIALNARNAAMVWLATLPINTTTSAGGFSISDDPADDV